MSEEVANTDYSKHTDEELQEGIRKAEENLARLEKEGTEDQRDAARAQHDAIQVELTRRNSN